MAINTTVSLQDNFDLFQRSTPAGFELIRPDLVNDPFGQYIRVVHTFNTARGRARVHMSLSTNCTYGDLLRSYDALREQADHARERARINIHHEFGPKMIYLIAPTYQIGEFWKKEKKFTKAVNIITKIEEANGVLGMRNGNRIFVRGPKFDYAEQHLEPRVDENFKLLCYAVEKRLKNKTNEFMEHKLAEYRNSQKVVFKNRDSGETYYREF